jgi:hypothetical protein
MLTVGALPDVCGEVSCPCRYVSSTTNIARALQVGMASLPSEGARRLVLLSDGNENVGAAAEAALMAQSLGVQIFSLPLGRPAHEPEVRVDKLIVPAQVKGGTPYRVEAVVASTIETPASLELFRDGTLVDRREVTLQPGKIRVRAVDISNLRGLKPRHAGLSRYPNGKGPTWTVTLVRCTLLLI